MAKNYSIAKCISPKEEYLKVFLAEQDQIEPVASLLRQLKQVYRCNITQSISAAHPDKTLTVYKKPMFDIDELISGITPALDRYFSNRTIVPEQIITEATFIAIENKILEQLDSAVNTIYVCMAWFTNDKFRAMLEKKQQQGIDVKVIIYNDGVNRTKGVNLSRINHKMMKASKGGIMHNKFCIIDNHVVITGSYNWTSNAELRNEENILIVQDWKNANVYTRQFLDMWNRILN